MTGSEHNDEYYIDENGETRTVSNRSGGVQGGISNGENIIIRGGIQTDSYNRQRAKKLSQKAVKKQY